MGSWNETCAISNLPILPGDKIYWLLLTKNPYTKFSSTGCYHYDFFFPRSIPIFGEYTDYGEIESVEGEEVLIQAMLNQFGVDLIEWLYKDHLKEDGSISREEFLKIPEVTMETLDFSNLQEHLHEGNIFIDSNALDNFHFIEDENEVFKKVDRKKPVRPDPVVKIMIRKDVWDALNSLTITNWSGLIDTQYFKEKEEEILDTILNANTKELVLMSKYIIVNEVKSIATDLPFANTCAESLINLIGKYNDKSISKEELKKTLTRARELKMLETIMSFTRRAWFPTTGAGSQTMEFDLCANVYKKFTEIAKKAQKEYKDEE